MNACCNHPTAANDNAERSLRTSRNGLTQLLQEQTSHD